MAHEMGRCSCGKKRHWHRNSKAGDLWKCYRCGTVTRLVDYDAPSVSKTKTVASKHSIPTSKSTYRSHQKTRHFYPRKSSHKSPPKRSWESEWGPLFLILAIAVFVLVLIFGK